MKNTSAVLKDRAVLAGWITGIMVIAAFIWSLSFPFRSAGLMYATNKTLAAMDDPRRLSDPVLRPFKRPNLSFADPLGCWYRLSEPGSLFFVFAIMREGILVPCGAEISEQGEVVRITPLGSHAQQVIGQIPQGLIQVYIRRIETAAAAMEER